MKETDITMFFNFSFFNLFLFSTHFPRQRPEDITAQSEVVGWLLQSSLVHLLVSSHLIWQFYSGPCELRSFSSAVFDRVLSGHKHLLGSVSFISSASIWALPKSHS